MCAHPRARHNEINNVKTWLHHEYNGAIDIHESQYVESTEDLVSIVHKAKTPLRRFLERLKLFRHSRLFRETRERVSQYPSLVYSNSDNR